jgi:nicotinamide riboside transporter PnuC
MFPMYILGIISWIKHQSKETNSVEVNTIDKKEWGFAILISIFIFIGIYFFVKSF